MKRSWFGAVLGAATLTWAGTALPCGGMFGPNATVDPSQTILVAHKAGTETYVFRPHFCGASTQFGLILPVPAALSKSPTLGDPALFDELAQISAPEVRKKTVCKGSEPQGDFGASNGGAGAPPGVAVIDKGQVGIFDWSLVKADSKASFTEWLDANGFPHAPAADAQFSHYVTAGWEFVAFKVTAGEDAPPAGMKLCGDFGPIELAFPTATPVVPTRIAAVSAGGYSPSWRVYGLSDPASQLTITQGQYPAMLSYGGALTATSLAGAPELAKLAAPGDRLVRLEVGFSFNGLADDLTLSTAAPQSMRATRDEIVYVDCKAGVAPPPTPTPGVGDPASGTSGSGSADDPTDGSAAAGAGGCVVARSARSGDLALGVLVALFFLGRGKKRAR
jgi:hypothetical protein